MLRKPAMPLPEIIHRLAMGDASPAILNAALAELKRLWDIRQHIICLRADEMVANTDVKAMGAPEL
jgi:hypothetical protein